MQIRAANLSGDCTFIREVERFVAQKKYAFPLFKQQQVCIISCRTRLCCLFCALLIAQGRTDCLICMQACVRRRAVLSMIGSPGCPDEAACESAVDSVWDTCYNDIAPFSRAP
jgi:hypothetical protein